METTEMDRLDAVIGEAPISGGLMWFINVYYI